MFTTHSGLSETHSLEQDIQEMVWCPTFFYDEEVRLSLGVHLPHSPQQEPRARVLHGKVARNQSLARAGGIGTPPKERSDPTPLTSGDTSSPMTASNFPPLKSAILS